jgi:hypothetical protein
MKLILKDNTEIPVTNYEDSYSVFDNADGSRTISITISNPPSNISVDFLVKTLTDENLSEIELVADGYTRVLESKTLGSVSEIIDEEGSIMVVRIR